MIMKRKVYIAVACLALIFAACTEKVSTQYTIGCLGHQSGSVEASQWQELERYFADNVEYNKLVTFEGTSLAENDAQAKSLCNSQLAKIDTAYVCGLLKSSDYFIYGIATLNASGTYRFVKAMKFHSGGTEEVSR